jgi:hypothetical protein
MHFIIHFISVENQTHKITEGISEQYQQVEDSALYKNLTAKILQDSHYT